MPGGATLPSLISRTRLQLHDSSTPFANAGADTDKAVNRLDQPADVDAFARNRRQSQLLNRHELPHGVGEPADRQLGGVARTLRDADVCRIPPGRLTRTGGSRRGSPPRLCSQRGCYPSSSKSRAEKMVRNPSRS